MWQAGDTVVLRSSYRGVVRWCWPHHYVGAWDGRHGIYVQPGARGKLVKRALDGGYLEYWASGAPPFDWAWERANVLRFMRPAECHTIEVWWDADWSFLGWYVNLQAPVTVNGPFLDTTDWALDITVATDCTWKWKDEDDLADAVRLGIFDAEIAARARAEGEHVIAAPPWPTGWEDWRPPPDWKPLELPDDWHVV